jgi:hypothetical protein
MKMWKAEPSLDYFKENSNPHLQMCNSQLFPLIALLAGGKRGKKEFWASGVLAEIRDGRGLMDAKKIDLTPNCSRRKGWPVEFSKRKRVGLLIK